MNRSVVRSFGIALASATIALTPLVVRAQAAPSGALSVDDVRATFIDRGYQVESPTTWWTNDHVTTFRVYPGSDPTNPSASVVMALVYADRAAAESVRTAASLRETPDAASNVAPHLVPGYGPSSWYKNVALVETTVYELQRSYAVAQARDNPMDAVSQATVESTPTPVGLTVQTAFIGLLADRAQANL